MGSFGRNVLGRTGNPIRVSADGVPLVKAFGITIDWSTVTAVSADTTLEDNTLVLNGDKYIRFGTVLDLIGTSEVQTVEYTGGATAGSAILTIPAAGTEPEQTAAALAFNASAANMQDALAALSRIGPGVSVARTGAGSAGDPYIFTITFPSWLGNIPQLTSTHSFTGGTTPSVTHGTTTQGAGTGKVGPVNTGASDGRQAMARGESYILDRTVLLSELGSDHPPVIEGGRVWRNRLVFGGSLEPTLANILTAFPGITLVD